MNVVLVIMDSLRTDHIYGGRARTAGVGQSWCATACASPAPTPRRCPRSPPAAPIMAGQRIYPFRAGVPSRGYRPARLGAGGHRPPDVARVPPGARLDHRLRDGQPAHLSLRADKIPQALRPAGADLRPGARGAADGHGHAAPRLEVYKYLPPSIRGPAPSRAWWRTCGQPAQPAGGGVPLPRACSTAAPTGSTGRARASRSRWWSTPSTPTSPGTCPRVLSDIYGHARPRREWSRSSPSLRRRRVRRAGPRQVAAASDGRALRGRGDDGRRLARQVARRPRQLGPARQHRWWSICSDHGVSAGRVRLGGKRYTEIHPALCHVPFAIRHPAGKAKGRASQLLRLHARHGPDVLVALGVDAADAMNGTDLSPLLDGKRPPRSAATAPPPTTNTVSARDGRWLLIADNQGPASSSTTARTTPVSTATSPPATRRGEAALGLREGRRRQAAAALQDVRRRLNEAGSSLVDRDVLDLGARAPGGRAARGTSRSASAV